MSEFRNKLAILHIHKSFISRLSMIGWVNVVLSRTIVVDSD